MAEAEDLVNRYHEELTDARIGILIRDEPQKNKGKYIWGHASTFPAKLKAYVNLDFIIWIADHVLTWESDRVRAILDHELSHCVFDRLEEKASIRGHDVEEFLGVIGRWGYWNHDLLALKEKTSQLGLDLPMPEFLVKRGRLVALEPEVMTRESE